MDNMLSFMLIQYERSLSKTISINNFDDNQFVSYFRFTKQQFIELLTQFGIPGNITLDNRSVITVEEFLMILLCRLAYPRRWVQLETLLCKNSRTLSMSLKRATCFLLTRFKEQLHLARGSIRSNCRQFAEFITSKGGIMPNVVGFIDGTAKKVCRPTHNQIAFYSGYKKIYCLKYQSLIFPNGIIQRSQPFNGRRNERRMLHESGLNVFMLEELLVNGTQYYIYGDPGYGETDWLVTPFNRQANLTNQQQEFNKSMSSVREAVEWGFGKIVNNWAFVDFSKNLKVELQPVGDYYLVAVLLTNIHTCMNRGIVNDYFGSNPPSIGDYLSGRWKNG